MKRVCSILAALFLSLVTLASCAKPLEKLAASELLDLGEKYLLEMDYAQAAVYFERLIEVEPRNRYGYTGLAEAYIGLDNIDDAVSALQEGAEKLSDDEDYLEEAADLYEDIIEKDPARADAYLGLADIFAQLGDEEKAADVLQRGLEQLPDDEKITAAFEKYAVPASTPLPGMPVDFTFASGVGAWSTEVTLNPDGTFSGYFHDSNMGETGDGYPNGTVYECLFSGKFTDIEKLGDYEYSMKIDYLKTEGTVGEETISDGICFITSEPYGFDNADEFLLYLPGRPTGDLPEEYLDWVRSPLAWSEMPEVLPFYGLYNVGGQAGFFSSTTAAEPAQTATETAAPSPSAPTDIFPAMSSTEHKALHTFFSNFAESMLNDFNINSYDMNKMIYFALLHNLHNYPDRWTFMDDGSYTERISKDYIEQTLTRFFGIDQINHSGYVDPYNNSVHGTRYEGGYYYFPSAAGEALSWAQVTEFYDNGDGTYTAKYDMYAGHVSTDDNIYADKSDWLASSEIYWYKSSCVALVKPYDYNGKATYQLLQLESAQ